VKLIFFYNFRTAETHATTLDAAIPEMGGDNTDYDTRHKIFNTIQKQENEEISQLEIDFKKSLRKYSDFYLDPPCSQKLPGQKSSQRLFPQTKTMTKYFCNHTGKMSELCVNPEESCAYSEIAKTVCLIHLMSILELSVSRSASQKCELDSLQPRCA